MHDVESTKYPSITELMSFAKFYKYSLLLLNRKTDYFQRRRKDFVTITWQSKRGLTISLRNKNLHGISCFNIHFYTIFWFQVCRMFFEFLNDPAISDLTACLNLLVFVYIEQ